MQLLPRTPLGKACVTNPTEAWDHDLMLKVLENTENVSSVS